MKHLSIYFLLAFVLSVRGYAQSENPSVLYFRINQIAVDSTYLNNYVTLQQLDELLSNTSVAARIDSLYILSFSSPDGNRLSNERLALQRSLSVRDSLLQQYPYIDASCILPCPQGENWRQLRTMIENDPNVPDREDVLQIIDRVPNKARCKYLLKKLDSGIPYSYIRKHILHHLRNVSVYLVWKSTPVPDTDLIVKKEGKVVVVEPELEKTEEPTIFESSGTEALHNQPSESARQRAKQTYAPSRWYLGAGGGVSFGRATFASFGVDKTRPGFNVGVLGGYKINNALSAELSLDYIRMRLGMYDCCQNLWLAADGNRYFAPLSGVQNYKYSDLISTTSLAGLGAHLNIDMVGIWCADSKWSALIAPAIYGVYRNAKVIENESAFHFSAGLDLGMGYMITHRVGLRLTVGMRYLTGAIDALPREEHRTSYVWDSGLKLIFKL